MHQNTYKHLPLVELPLPCALCLGCHPDAGCTQLFVGCCSMDAPSRCHDGVGQCLHTEVGAPQAAIFLLQQSVLQSSQPAPSGQPLCMFSFLQRTFKQQCERLRLPHFLGGALKPEPRPPKHNPETSGHHPRRQRNPGAEAQRGNMVKVYGTGAAAVCLRP